MQVEGEPHEQEGETLTACFARHGDRRQLAKRASLHRSGDAPISAYLVVSGWLSRVRLGPAGAEAFMGVYIAGDIIALDALAFDRLPDEVAALSECTLLRLSLDTLRQAIARNPALATDAMRLLAGEGALLREALFAVGTQSSAQRLCTFLLQTYDRLLASGAVSPHATQWALPLTQSQLGGVLGLTSVHVNRTLRSLKDAGLLDLSGGIVRGFDREGLRREAQRVA